MKKRKQQKKINTSITSKYNVYMVINSLFLSWLALTNILLIGKYDILPLKYFIPVLAGLIIIPSILIFVMLKRKIKTKIRTICSIFSIILIIILSIVLFYLNKTFSFLDKLKAGDYYTENYSIIVMNDKEYSEVNELEETHLEYLNQEQLHINEALEKLNEIVKPQLEEEQDYNVLANKLYNNEVDAIMIEESYRNMIEENKENFSKETKVIYTIEVKTEKPVTAKHVDVKAEPFNVYITGIDTYGSISAVSRSDVNIVATVNPNTHQVLLITIPRDYYVQLADTTGYKDKLTHAGIYGIEKQVKTIENLLDIEINYYAKVNFSSLENIVNALGTVDVYSEYSFTGYEGTIFTQGYNKVNGAQALDFARTRKTVSGGDRTRGQNQQALIQAILNKACSKEIITKYSGILSSLEGSFQTNMSTDKMTDIIKKQIDEMAKWNVTSISLEGYDDSAYTYSGGSMPLYVMVPYEDSIEEAKEKIKEVKEGKILESSYIENTGQVNIPGQGTPQWMYEYSAPEITQNQPEPTPQPAEEPKKQEEPETNTDTENKPENATDDPKENDEESEKQQEPETEKKQEEPETNTDTENKPENTTDKTLDSE